MVAATITASMINRPARVERTRGPPLRQHAVASNYEAVLPRRSMDPDPSSERSMPRTLSRIATVELIAVGAVAVILGVVAFRAVQSADRRRLRVDVLSPRQAEPDATVAVTVRARDGKGRAQGADLDFGDGHTDRIRAVTLCTSDPTTRSFAFEHQYESPGKYTLRAVVQSRNCDFDDENSGATRMIEVQPTRN